MNGYVKLTFSVSGSGNNGVSTRYIRKEEMSKPYLDKLAAEMVGSVLERVFNER